MYAGEAKHACESREEDRESSRHVKEKDSLVPALDEVFHQWRIKDSNTVSIFLGPFSFPGCKLTVF